MEKRKLINSISYNKSDIDYRFKIIYAIAIIAVACGHCNGGGAIKSFLVFPRLEKWGIN